MTSPDLSRRTFIKQSSLAGLSLAAMPWVQASEAGRVYRTALIGSGWWGKNILKEAVASRRCKIVALGDVDQNVLEIAAEQVSDLNGDKPKVYPDYRELLAKEKPEIVIIATPDHWHALITIDALKAGAHVFVEKPTGHSVHESAAMLRVARESGRVVQVGLHRRVAPHHVSAMRFLHSGKAGEIGMVRLFACSGGGKENPAPNEDVPDGMNWDMWCGPSAKRPFNKKLHPGGWRSFLDYGNGTLGDWGVHWLDQVLWWSEEKYPKTVFCSGGRSVRGAPVNDERGQTSDAPDHQVATYQFDKFTCVWEHRQFGENGPEKHRIGAYFYGTKGIVHIGWRDGWTFYPASRGGSLLHEDSQLQEPDGHNLKLLWADFLEAIDRAGTPVAGIEAGHRASVLPLLGMASWRLGRSLEWDGAGERVMNDPAANQLLAPPLRAPWSLPS